MVGIPPRLAAVPLLLLVLCRATFGLEPPPGPGDDPSPETIPDDLEEVDAVLRTLDEAGVPPTREEVAGFLKEQEVLRRAGPAQEGRPFISGSASYRAGHYQSEGLDHYGKISLTIFRLRLRGRFREYRTGLRDATGAAELDGGPVEIRAGWLGLNQGHGLLAGAPGRGASLAADSGFHPRSEGLVTWLGQEDARAVLGYGASGRVGPWTGRVLMEYPGSGSEDGRGRHTLVQLGLAREAWRLSAAGHFRGGGGGASVAAALAAGPLSGSLEFMGMIPERGIPPAGAALMQVNWSPARGSGLEGQVGFADLPEGPSLANRPAVLTGWDGAGVAVRGYTRTGAGLAARGLVQAGRHLDRSPRRRLHTKLLVDLQAGQEVRPDVDVSLRYRRDTRRTWEWAERYPWQEARLADTGHRTVVTLQAVYEKAHNQVRLMGRTYVLESGAGGGRRNLIGGSGRRRLGRRWRLRVLWASAWGDPVDLVSALSPLAGYVLPRHWGRWRSETVLGLEWTPGPGRIQAAVSIRQPEGAPPSGSAITLWGSGEIAW